MKREFMNPSTAKKALSILIKSSILTAASVNAAKIIIAALNDSEKQDVGSSII